MSKGKRNRARRMLAESAVFNGADPRTPVIRRSDIKRAVAKETKAAAIKAHEQFWVNEAATILWTVHEQCGFGQKRLKAFFDAYSTRWQELRDYYEMADADVKFICAEKLKEMGVDVAQWMAERE